MGVTHGLVFLSLFGLTAGSVCSESNRRNDLSRCLLEIGGAGFNETAFWFGTQYATDCPRGMNDPRTECYNAMPNARSIFRRIFPDGYKAVLLDRFLDMEFISPPGSYSGCGNVVSQKITWTQNIDPLENVVLTPWYTRLLPDLGWTTSPGEMFTLLVYDVGHFFIHGVYVNILGNDTTTAEIIKTYNGPQASNSKKNLYIFLLFSQSDLLNVSQDLRDRIEQNIEGNVTVSELKDEWNLTGPVALNWIVVTGDEYAAQRMLDRYVLNMCPNFVADGLNQVQRPFLPRTASLSMSVNVKFNTTPTEFTACCSKHSYGNLLSMSLPFPPTPVIVQLVWPEASQNEEIDNVDVDHTPHSAASNQESTLFAITQDTFDLTPLSNPVYDTYTVSQFPSVSFLKKGLYFMAQIFTGEMYTLVTVDPDVPVSTVGTEERPLLHWLVTNIEHGNIMTGDEYASYNGPNPPDRTVHYYYFLLYKQESAVNVSSISSYAGDCPARLAGRCLFNINEFVAEQNLTLVGASWMTATTDIYVAYRKISGGESMTDWCGGMPGYGGDPSCPISVSPRAMSVSVFTLLLVVIATFVE